MQWGFNDLKLGLKDAILAVPEPKQIRIAEDVQARKRIHFVDPDYPAEAREKGIEGTVLIQAVIGADGAVQGMNVIGDPLLARAAMDAVKQWRYQTTHLNGEPVEVLTEIRIRFEP